MILNKLAPVLMLLARSSSILSAAILQVVSAKLLGIETYGTFAFASTISLFMLNSLSYTIPQSVRRSVAKNKSNLATGMSLVNRIYLPLAVLASLAGTAIFLLAPVPEKEGTSLIVTGICLLFEIVLRSGGLQPRIAILNGLGLHSIQLGIVVTQSVLRLVLPLVLIQHGAGLPGALAGLAISSLVLIIPCEWLLRKEMRLSDAASAPAGEVERDLAEFLRSGPLFMLLFSAIQVISVAEFTIFCSVPSIAGAFSGAYVFSRTIVSLGQAYAGGTFSEIAHKIAAGTGSEALRKLESSLTGMLLIMSPGVAALSKHGDSLLRLLYGNDFRLGRYCITMIYVGMCALAITAMICDFLEAAGRLKLRVWVLGMGTVAIAVLTPFAIDQFDENGAATIFCGVSCIVSIFLWFDVYMITAQRYPRIRLDWILIVIGSCYLLMW